MELLKVDTIEEALKKLLSYAGGNNGIPLKEERVSVRDGFNRILARDIESDEDVPGFMRSSVDGYAVCAMDTSGAGEKIPTFLKIVGEVFMGQEPEFEIEPGTCAYIPTGGMLPKGADSVVMTEFCERFGKDKVAIYESTSLGRCVVNPGDDVKKGQIVLKRGRKLRAEDIGLLSSLGITEIDVFSPWNISIISTGDEVIRPEEKPKLGQVRDINSYALEVASKEYGFKTKVIYCEDDREKLSDIVKLEKKESDMVLLSGGSSQGKKDETSNILDEISTSGVFTHGLSVKPGKPTILSYDEEDRTALIGLPGHPVAALTLFRLIAGGLWEELTNSRENGRKYVYGRITTNLPASPGRKTYQLIKITGEESDYPLVSPVLGKSGLIRTMSEADGYIEIDVNCEGINKGQVVKVYYL